MSRQRTPRHINFKHVNTVALARLPELLRCWLPDGHVQGREYLARNPRRADEQKGSFCINLNTGRWGDFATTDRGGDVVSLAAYLGHLTQAQAARQLANMLGVTPWK